MRTCRQCRFAQRGTTQEEKLCVLCAQSPKIVGAGQAACGNYEVSAYAYLESVAYAEKRIERMAAKAKRYFEAAGYATGSREAVRTSGGGHSKIADNMACCLDLARDMEREAAELRARLGSARQMIRDVSTAEGREVVDMRHMGRMRWEEIARRLKYDPSAIRRIDKRALHEIQQMMIANGIIR